ncbi:MAG: AbrB/MazE/SpoVT family DNA-binding domain-containing protein [Acidobacteria bacterium]|nr:AbrB/MazE/SpoVT family DNA-binding domain-containing protein [Acidobacteriota bacterium]
MVSTLSTKGQLIIPSAVRKKMRLDSGTRFKVDIVGDKIVLEPLREDPVQRLYGRFKGEDLLGELEREHAKELIGDDAADLRP